MSTEAKIMTDNHIVFVIHSTVMREKLIQLPFSKYLIRAVFFYLEKHGWECSSLFCPILWVFIQKFSYVCKLSNLCHMRVSFHTSMKKEMCCSLLRLHVPRTPREFLDVTTEVKPPIAIWCVCVCLCLCCRTWRMRRRKHGWQQPEPCWRNAPWCSSRLLRWTAGAPTLDLWARVIDHVQIKDLQPSQVVFYFMASQILWPVVMLKTESHNIIENS